MDEEGAFLSAIAADPADDTNRLVYADWLEERGDLRAEYIRLRLSAHEPHGRKRVLARLKALSRRIDREWRGRVFCVPRLSIAKYRRVRRPVLEPVTKFGGQPVWVDGPMWPIARRGEPMRFVCQVAVPAFFGPALAGKMVYVFAVHPEHADWEAFLGTFSPLDPEEGDNAVVIQPGGDPPAPMRVTLQGVRPARRRKAPTRVEVRATGPTLYDDKGRPGEWLLDLEPGADPDYAPNTMAACPDEDDWERYRVQVDGEKVGGTPPWSNSRTREVDRLAIDPDWRLLLHYDYRGPYFSVWENGFEWSVWVTRDGKRGLLMGGQ